MFGSSFRFRQKCQQLPGNLTYSHAGLHSDRLAGLCTPFPLADFTAEAVELLNWNLF